MVNIVLASASSVRGKLLTNAGICFEARAAGVDESAIKLRCRNENKSVEDTALILAQTKAVEISNEMPNALVIGADQILEQEGKWFDKPQSRAEARSHLKYFSNKKHRLITATAVIENGNVVWQHVDSASLQIRLLDDDFIESYLDAIGDDALLSVGAYQLEGRGIQLFNSIDGDFFTILGLPLLPLLAFLRQRSLIDSPIQ
ncbi:MAG: septum formation protein Maf [Rhodospirillaceae bacterium]|jgi:septum formation protein|nr:septum formation protein Maf [Rhodospirillaceae bacterium]